MRGVLLRWLAGLTLVAVLGLAGLVAALNTRDEAPISADVAADASPPDPRQIERGAYLALAGNCAACHTARGGADYAGGLGIRTPFGTVHASNLTPDAETGIGDWSSEHFWRAMHNGRSKDGRLLYPAFPYTEYTQMTREDADAIFAYLRSLPPVGRPNTPHRLRFPYDTQASLAVWRALFFRPAAFEEDVGQSAQWNQGAYLVRGLGHCAACHSARNFLGARSGSLELGGGLIPMQNWYAPSLVSTRQGGVQDWAQEHVVALLRDGMSPRGSALGPMAEVVFRSTQHLTDADLQAMAVYLGSIPAAADPPPAARAAEQEVMERGAKIYAEQCAGCHGEQGQGAQGAYPPLSGNRAVTMDETVNLVRVLLSGGFPPTTAGNPRPYGMLPFGHVLNDAEIADVLTYIRQSWGHAAAPVSVLDVHRAR